MTKPTYQDAQLQMQLAAWHTTSGLPSALNWLWSEAYIADYCDFCRRYPPGSDGDGNAALICTFFETVGALYKHGLINEDLLFDWLAVSWVWDKIKSYVLGRRRVTETPTLWANFEALATANKRSTREYST